MYKEESIGELNSSGLNHYLTSCLNAIFELSNIDELQEINSLNYDKTTNKLVIGVNKGIWVLSEDSKGLKGVYCGD